MISELIATTTYRKEDGMYTKYVQLRDAKGVTDYAVSKATGIPQSTLTDWKTGRSKPKLDKLIRIAKYFDVLIDELAKED